MSAPPLRQGRLLLVAALVAAAAAGYASTVVAVAHGRLLLLGVASLLLALPFMLSLFRYGVLILLLFVFLALVRRVFPGPANDPAAFLPTLATIPLAVLALQRRLPWHIGFYLLTVLFSAAIGYRHPLVSLLGLVVTAAPLLAGHYLNDRHSAPGQPSPYLKPLSLFLVVVSCYGLFQFFAIPAFDRSWQVRTEFLSANLPGTSAFRPWSTLASPGTAAAFSALTLLALLSTRRSPLGRVLTWTTLTLGVSFLALTKVRVGWVMLIVGVGYLLVSRKLPLRPVLAAAALAGILLATVGRGPVLSGITERAATLSSLSTDGSTQTRLSTYKQIGDAVVSVPQGLGAVSSGSRAASAGVNIDNGYLVSIVEGGPLGLLGVLVLLAGQARRSGPMGRTLVLALAVLNAAVGSLSGLPLLLVFLLSDNRVTQPGSMDSHAKSRGRS